MSTAAAVPTTHDLEGDDAIETLRSVGLRELARDALLRFRLADGFSHARALAFQITLTLLPAVIAVVGLARVLDQRDFSRVLTQTIQDLAPGPAGEVLTQAIRHGSETGSSSSGRNALIVGLLVALISAATAMGQVERGSNRIYGVERDRPTFRKYLGATALACTAGLAILGAFVLLVLGSSLGAALGDVTGWGEPLETAWAIGRWPLGAVLIAAGVALIFKASPNRRQPSPSWLALGSGLAVALWSLFTGLFALYVEVTDSFGQTYGPLAGVIGLLLWSFLTALALFLGLAVAAQLEAVRAQAPEPRAGAALDSRKTGD
jgi:YihY family inner membrane protein